MPQVKVVRAFRYRSARVTGKVFSMPREFVQGLEDYCAEELDIMKDNHTAYEIVCDWDVTVYVMFSDFRVTFGTSIVEEAW